MTKDEIEMLDNVVGDLDDADAGKRASSSNSTQPYGGGAGTRPMNQMVGSTPVRSSDMNATADTRPITWNLTTEPDDAAKRAEREARHRADDASFLAFRRGHVVSPGRVSGLGPPTPPTRKA